MSSIQKKKQQNVKCDYKKVRNWKISSLLCWIDSYETDRKIPFLKVSVNFFKALFKKGTKIQLL